MKINMQKGLKELTKEEMKKINGGSEWSEAIFFTAAAAAHCLYHCARAFTEGAKSGTKIFYK